VPELPEVEIVRRQLHRAMTGARIHRVETRRDTLRGPLPPDFAARLEGRTVQRVTRRAKYLLVELSSGDILLMHLGMSGSFRVVSGRRAQAPGQFHYDRSDDVVHDHVVFEMSSGARIVFNDPRRFGSMTLVAADRQDTHATLNGLGPEPLSRDFTAERLALLLRGRRTTIKSALQRIDWHSQVTVDFVGGSGGAGWNRSKRTVTVNSEYLQRFIAQGVKAEAQVAPRDLDR
jgi:formamidopyrimidine-DNA glycosylase